MPPGTNNSCCDAPIALTPARPVPTIAGLCLSGTLVPGMSPQIFLVLDQGTFYLSGRFSKGIYGDDDPINPDRPK
jgi:hypothetical protein